MKKAFSGLLICGVVLALYGVQEASADVVSKVPTEGDITFTVGGKDDTEDPNPDPNPDPDPDPKPDDDPDPHNDKALRFTYLPDISFGTSEINAQSLSYYYAHFLNRDYEAATGPEDGVYPTFLTVQDLRGGAKGWKVTVTHDGKFVNTEDPTDSLKANIQLNNANIKTNTFTDPADIAKYAPTSRVATGETSDYTNISTGSAVEIITATAGTGYGKWSQGFGDTSIQTTGKGLNGTGTSGAENATKKGRNLGVRLEFPAQVTQTDTGKNKYSADLFWGLDDTL